MHVGVCRSTCVCVRVYDCGWCVYVYCVHVYTSERACVRVWIYVYMCICMCVFMLLQGLVGASVWLSMHTGLHVCMCVCSRTGLCVRTFVFVGESMQYYFVVSTYYRSIMKTKFKIIWMFRENS